ncbi:MAG TPA: uroporphyrinogen III synthase [Rhizobium sp.]|nr:uroporphyrinogen III synthase [Rhizobium sp.]
MRVLVTRPEHAGRETAERLRSLGHEPILLPMSAPVHDPQAALAGLSSPHSAIAITSAEAIRTLSKLGEKLAPYFADPLFAVGKASARAGEGAGFRKVIASTGDGIALADNIKVYLREHEMGGGPLLYLTGRPRSGGFEAQLAAHRIPFTVCECYEMRAFNYEAAELQAVFEEDTLDAVLFYSPESAKRFFAQPYMNMNSHPLNHLHYFCMSENVLLALPLRYRQNASVAATPDEAALLALL